MFDVCGCQRWHNEHEKMDLQYHFSSFTIFFWKAALGLCIKEMPIQIELTNAVMIFVYLLLAATALIRLWGMILISFGS